tara:strand:+ start:481 stop:867 length:387 start_codon:yes stop_codon:yes gene_type:complete
MPPKIYLSNIIDKANYLGIHLFRTTGNHSTKKGYIMEHTITCCLYWEKFHWEKEGEYVVYQHKMDDCEYRVFVKNIEVKFEAPQTHDPRAQMVVALEGEKKVVMADMTKKITVIDGKIQSLLALENNA